MNDYSHCKNCFLIKGWNLFWSKLPLVFSRWLLMKRQCPLCIYPGILTGILRWDCPWAFSSPGRRNLQSEEISFCHSSEAGSLVMSSQGQDPALVFAKLHTVAAAHCSSLSRSLCKISLPPDMSTSPPAWSPQWTWCGQSVWSARSFMDLPSTLKSHWLPLTVSLLSLIFCRIFSAWIQWILYLANSASRKSWEIKDLTPG